MKSASLHIARTNILAKAAFNQIPVLREWYGNMSVEYAKNTLNNDEVKKYKYLENQLNNFDELQNSSEHQLNFFCEEPLGLFCYASLILSNSSSKKFIQEVEIDVRSDVNIYGKNVNIQTAEIKSGHDRDKAIQQLVTQLTLLKHASSQFFPETHFEFSLRGSIFTYVSGWKSPSVAEIEKAATKVGIKNVPVIDINVINF